MICYNEKMSLSDKKCVPCEGGVQPLGEKEIQGYFEELENGWEVLDNKKIKKEFKFQDFKTALDFVNKAGEIAENESHHPDITLSWGRVVVLIWTHAIGGLSENDFILAAKIEKVV